MQNKRIYFIMAAALIVVAAAAFVGGRLLNGQAGPLGLFPMLGGPGQMAVSIEMIPAPELPKTEPETQGTFVERNDNTITLQTFSMEMGKGGVVVSKGPDSGDDSGGPSTSNNGDEGPKVEVVVTNETIIYRDATGMGMEPPQSGETTTIQQVVEAGTLDDLKSDSMVMVWGRKNGDRIIADVLVYSQPVIFKRPAP